MTERLLDIRGLKVMFDSPDGVVEAVRGVDLDVKAGETVAVVGESGSGKSQLVMAAIGLLAANGRVEGSARYRGQQLVGLPRAALNKVRGVKIAMIFQEPMTSLDPLQTIEVQIGDPLVFHQGLRRSAARKRVLELLGLVGIADPQSRMNAYPHQLSGGQRQRVLIAMALANEPEILIADEPTTALDVTVQAQILDLLRSLQQRFGMAIVFITHDLGIVRRFADRVYVMRHGRVIEHGAAQAIMTSPTQTYTRELLDAEPQGRKPPVKDRQPWLVEARDIDVEFPLRTNWLGRVTASLRAVAGVSLSIRRGQTVGVVGESGSGKSTLGRAILQLLPARGTVLLSGEPIHGRSPRQMQPLRKRLQVVFQDPFGSLSPRLTVGEIIGEGLRVHAPEIDARERDRRVAAAMADVGLDTAWLRRYPHEFSGGQRQRIAIARAIVLRPEFVLLDEPTSALDRTIQKQVVELLRRLQDEHRLTYLFISHDLAVVRAMADTVLVMKSGRVVEGGATEAIFADPQARYTRELMAAAAL